MDEQEFQLARPDSIHDQPCAFLRHAGNLHVAGAAGQLRPGSETKRNGFTAENAQGRGLARKRGRDDLAGEGYPYLSFTPVPAR